MLSVMRLCCAWNRMEYDLALAWERGKEIRIRNNIKEPRVFHHNGWNLSFEVGQDWVDRHEPMMHMTYDDALALFDRMDDIAKYAQGG